MTYQRLVEKLREIKTSRYIRTHRAGTTGVGKTLEDLLGIEENNVPGPNAAMIELKSARRRSPSMLTLFTKSPLPRGANAQLLQQYGYVTPQSHGRKRLETTVNAMDFNQLRGSPGFKVDTSTDRVMLITPENDMVGYWDRNTLRISFERKLPHLLYVKAESRGRGADEEFWYDEAWLLSGFAFENFIRLILDGVICVDIRIGQYPDGRTHDHGTGFRVRPDKLDLCFENRTQIM